MFKKRQSEYTSVTGDPRQRLAASPFLDPHYIEAITMQSVRQATQRKYTQLVNWLHGDNDRLQRMLTTVKESNPDQDNAWCIDKLWTDESAWRGQG